MQTFKEYLEERDPELLSEINWRKALATGTLAAASLLPSAGQAAEQPSSYHGYGQTSVDYQKGTGVGGDNIATQKLYKKGYEGIKAEETLKQDITTILKSMKGRVISEEVKIKDVYIQFIEIEKDLGKDTSFIKIYGAVKAEVLIEVHVEISGPGASQEMAYQYAEMAAKKLLDSKGFKYQRVKDVMGKELYGTRDIVKDMGIRPQSEQINNSEVFKVKLNFEVTLRDLTRHLK
jgi:hypothetical protein